MVSGNESAEHIQVQIVRDSDINSKGTKEKQTTFPCSEDKIDAEGVVARESFVS